MNAGVTHKPVAMTVCDDTAMRAVLRHLLEAAGCAVVEVAAVADLSPSVRPETVAVIVVVASCQSNTDGVAALAALHCDGWRVPLVLCARNMTSALRQRAFTLGARDVIGLPIIPRELHARLQAILSRHANWSPSSPTGATPTCAGGLVVHPATHIVSSTSADWSIRLTKCETILLTQLMSAPGRVLGRNDLLDRVWGEEYEGDDTTLSMHIRRLRAKLAHRVNPHEYIRTVRGQGYTFDARRAPRIDSVPTATGIPDMTGFEQRRPDRSGAALSPEPLSAIH